MQGQSQTLIIANNFSYRSFSTAYKTFFGSSISVCLFTVYQTRCESTVSTTNFLLLFYLTIGRPPVYIHFLPGMLYYTWRWHHPVQSLVAPELCAVDYAIAVGFYLVWQVGYYICTEVWLVRWAGNSK
jgi:hypothetical protein